MPRKKPVTAADLPEQPLGSAEYPVLSDALDPAIQALQSLTTLKYSDEDMQKLDQFAIGLLRDGTGAFDATDAAFTNRVRSAYLRAEVMLTIRKEIAALEA